MKFDKRHNLDEQIEKNVKNWLLIFEKISEIWRVSGQILPVYINRGLIYPTK